MPTLCANIIINAPGCRWRCVCVCRPLRPRHRHRRRRRCDVVITSEEHQMPGRFSYIYPFLSPASAINKFFIILRYILYPTQNDVVFCAVCACVCVCLRAPRSYTFNICSFSLARALQIFVLTLGFLDDGSIVGRRQENIISGMICGRRFFLRARCAVVVIFFFVRFVLCSQLVVSVTQFHQPQNYYSMHAACVSHAQNEWQKWRTVEKRCVYCGGDGDWRAWNGGELSLFPAACQRTARD